MRSPRPLDDATVLVGRDDELERVTDLVSRASRGSGQLLLVDGEAGIGKSAMLSCVVDRARSAGMTVLAGRCDELGRSRPFAPVIEALESGGSVAESGLAQVRQSLAVTRLGPPLPLDVGADAQTVTVDALTDVIDALCVSGPVAIALDDVHWADAASLVALSSLARRSGDLPLLVALTHRPAPIPVPLATFLGSLGSRRSALAVTRLGLGALGAADASGVAADRIGRAIGPRLGALVSRCGGNPLLVLELVAGLTEAGLLRQVADVVDTDLDSPGQLPETFHETVRRRMAVLDGEARALATIAALLGTRFTFADLAAAARRRATDLLPVVELLVDARLLREDGDTLAYRHDLVRDVVSTALSPSLRGELHRDIAEGLRLAGASTVQVAEHLALGAPVGSGDAVAVLRAAAEEIVHHDPAGAVALLRRAIEICRPTDPDRDGLLAQLVDALTWSGSIAEATATADEMLTRPLAHQVEGVLRSAMSRSLLLLGRPQDALAHVEQLIELHQAAGASIAWPLAECAICRLFGLDLDGALQEADRAVHLGERDGDQMAVVLGLCVEAFARTALGQSALAVERATRATTLADATPDGAGHRLHPNLFRTVALQSMGRTTQADHAARRGRSLGEALGASWALPVYHFLAALAHWDAGSWDDLLAEVDAGLAHSEERASTIGQVWAFATAARVHVHRGELSAATDLVDRGQRILAEHGPQFGADWLALTQALLLEAEGRRADGLDALRFVWDAATGLGASAALVLVGGDLTRLAVEAGDDATADQVVAALTTLASVSPDDPVLLARLARSRGLAERDPAWSLAAAEAFGAIGHRFETALVLEELADLELASGAVDAATARLERVLVTYDDLRAARESDRVRARLARLRPRGQRMPIPRRALSGWPALTPTELLVVDEICTGRTNKEVADRLGISRRTVEAHLRSIYPKLGVAGRVALVIVAGERRRG